MTTIIYPATITISTTNTNQLRTVNVTTTTQPCLASLITGGGSCGGGGDGEEEFPILNHQTAVTFNSVVHVEEFEKVTPAEAEAVWFDSNELDAFRNEGKYLAYSYRKQYDDHYDIDCSESEDDSEDDADDTADSGMYRGFEGRTVLRHTQKLLSNCSVVYANKIGMQEHEIAAVYKECNQFSIDVAYVQAQHDRRAAAAAAVLLNNDDDDIRPILASDSSLLLLADDDDEDDTNDDGIIIIHELIPSVQTMVPPPPVPFAIQSIRAMRAARTA